MILTFPSSSLCNQRAFIGIGNSFTNTHLSMIPYFFFMHDCQTIAQEIPYNANTSVILEDRRQMLNAAL